MIAFVLILLVVNCEARIELYLFSRTYPTEKILLDNNNLNLINVSNSIKFIIHGWGENSDRAYYHDMTNAYIKHGDYNVIQVDWNELAKQFYFRAVSNTRIVGEFVGEFIILLHKSLNIPLENVHIIGHSLGGHVAGFAGKTVIKQLDAKVNRISGLDPAGPSFEGNVALERLDKDDAEMVDITHTDINYYGYDDAIGTVDFYANGGHRPQPGCELFSPELYKLDPLQIAFCSHTRSYHFFIESINSNGFLATKCNSYQNYLSGACDKNEKIIYGESTLSNTEGIYFFSTKPSKPYALGTDM